jgi:hypothetical protein
VLSMKLSTICPSLAPHSARIQLSLHPPSPNREGEMLFPTPCATQLLIHSPMMNSHWRDMEVLCLR